MAIEKKFGIKFDFDELTALHNVGEMLELIEKKIAGKNRCFSFTPEISKDIKDNNAETRGRKYPLVFAHNS